MVQANWGAPPAYGGDPEDHVTYPNENEAAAGRPSTGSRGGDMLSIAGAILSIALLAGMGFWGYRLAVRDVTGVPVVQALEGPMRIQPEDPGGEEAAYQGYAVNVVQGEGGAAEPATTLALAPENTGLAPEDQPPGSNGDVARAAPAPADPEAAMQALAEQIAAGVEPLTDVTPTSADSGAAVAEAGQAVAAVQAIPASVPGLARSPRPVIRPAGLVRRAPAGQAAPAPAPEVAAPEAVREVAASAIPLGTQLVQLGAFDSPEVARAEWDKLAQRFEDYFGNKQRVVMQATSGGRSFWRLRAVGFENLSDARRFCAVLATARAACIPVVTR